MTASLKSEVVIFRALGVTWSLHVEMTPCAVRRVVALDPWSAHAEGLIAHALGVDDIDRVVNALAHLATWNGGRRDNWFLASAMLGVLRAPVAQVIAAAAQAVVLRLETMEAPDARS